MLDTNLLEDQPIAWTPTPEVIERAQLTRFMKQVGVTTWDELYQFSIANVEKFTEEVLKFLDIKFDPPYEKLLDISDGVEFPKWFEGRRADTPVRTSANHEGDIAASDPADKRVRVPAGLNITEMCLDRWQTDEMKGQTAVIWEDEAGADQTVTYGELLKEVELCAAGLRRNELAKGDAIGIHLPMIPETVMALLAINRIGAIAVPVFSGYGVEAIASRLNAVGAKALFGCTGFHRRGRQIMQIGMAAEVAERCPSIKKVFIVESLRKGFYILNPDQNPLKFRQTATQIRPITGEQELNPSSQMSGGISFGLTPGHNPTVPKPYHVQAWGDIVRESNNPTQEVTGSEPTLAEDPLIILYTSGTTGKPKGIAHTHGSFPIKAAQDMAFGTDVGKDTRISWYTDIGWMMGPWLIYGALINGATICIYDGAPDYPTPDRMWEFCAKHNVEVLGISPTLIRSLAASDARREDTPVRPSASSAADKTEETRADKSVRPPRRDWHSRGHLPHFDGEVTQFITFRLADSLPAHVLKKLKVELKQEKLGSDSREYRIRIENYIDQGAGDCMLRNPAVAEIVRATILIEHEKSCVVRAWVIMPNHVHLLLRARAGYELSGIMQRIKGVSARKINRLLGRNGPIWQADYFDSYIREEEHYFKAIRYIHNNPVKAGLCEEKETWVFSSAYAGESEMDRDNEIRIDKPARADRSVRPPLPALRIFASTGEPWNPAPWWWLFEEVGKSKLPIINYSGGTEISGGILMGNPLLPQKPCSFPAPCPGMDVDILDENGESVEPGKVGELVIKQPWIGMARGFWQERERYLDTYWRRFKNIWVHGDWTMRDADGHYFILGRSDDTLKIAGKRVGPAEVESLLVAHPLVIEAAVIGVPDEVKGTAMVAFCVTKVQASLLARGAGDEHWQPGMPALGSELKSLVARDMGKPLAPSQIHFVSALPKTRNAKVMRRVLRSAYLGEDPGDLSALENPKSVAEIQKLRL